MTPPRASVTEFDRGYALAGIHALVWAGRLSDADYRNMVCALAIGAIKADKPLVDLVDSSSSWDDDALWSALREAYDACPTWPGATAMTLRGKSEGTISSRNLSVAGVTLPELATAAGLEYRTAHVWVHRGLLTPTIHESEGTGHPNRFAPEDVTLARALAELRHAGVSLNVLARVNGALRLYPATKVRVPLGGNGHYIEVDLLGAQSRADIALNEVLSDAA